MTKDSHYLHTFDACQDISGDEFALGIVGLHLHAAVALAVPGLLGAGLIHAQNLGSCGLLDYDTFNGPSVDGEGLCGHYLLSGNVSPTFAPDPENPCHSSIRLIR